MEKFIKQFESDCKTIRSAICYLNSVLNSNDDFDWTKIDEHTHNAFIAIKDLESFVDKLKKIDYDRI